MIKNHISKFSLFYYDDNKFHVEFSDGTEVIWDTFPINCSYVGNTVDAIDDIIVFESYWDFNAFEYCPICINNKWGFINNQLKFIIQPKYDSIGEYEIIGSGSCYSLTRRMHSVYLKNGLLSVVFNGKQLYLSSSLQEFYQTNYYTEINALKELKLEKIIEISRQQLPNKYTNSPWAYVDNQGRTLEHGKVVLETEEQCCAYMAAYGLMHRHKLVRALEDDKFPYSSLNNGVELYDWGCGQGIGTIAVIEEFKKRGLLHQLHKVTLEEPSNVARSRAVLHVSKALEGFGVNIVETSKYLPSDYGDNSSSITSIKVEQPCAIHIFSNILDIEAVSLKGVSKMITSSGQRHIALCIGPANLNESRINSFKNYFKSEGLEVFTDFRDTMFGRHKNGRAYGCLIKSFTYILNKAKGILHEYKYFAPIQKYALYSDKIENCDKINAAFEILAPFDMTAHRDIWPTLALISNLISRGCPTLASKRIEDALADHSDLQRQKEYMTIARIQKTLVEAMISDRLPIIKDEWNILVVEDGTDVAQLAIDDFSEMYEHLIAMTEMYYHETLPKIKLSNKQAANASESYDIIIDVSVDKYSEPEKVVFSKYKANNDCYFIVRSSKEIFEERYLYTTGRIKYKPFVEKNEKGMYDEVDEERTKHLRYFLNLIFRKGDFRPGQLPILSRALQLKSVIGLLPTGGGKSLTYQLAAMLQPAITLVVDPLKGLMKNQYDALLHLGIDCVDYINGDVEDKEARQSALTNSQTQIMFLSPERLSIYRFREVLSSMRESNVYFAYGVIDEVHCVSEWGHDFRLAYLHLGRNLYNYVLPKEVEGEDNHISMFGLTATASFDVLADVERELSGRHAFSLEDDATVRYENTNRLELQYYVYEVNANAANNAWNVGDIKEDVLINVINDATNKIDEIQNEDSVELIKNRFVERENITDGDLKNSIRNTNLDVSIKPFWYSKHQDDASGIVFCLRAGDKQEEIDFISPQKPKPNLSVPSVLWTLYNKGITLLSTCRGGDDTSCQNDFINNKTKLMVATKAFGMGIDKSNVRLTFHLNYPGSLESFVQEAGRAGRDKKMALATIMYSPKKFPVKNVKTGEWQQLSADYKNNKFFYDSNFLGEEFELYVMKLLMNNLRVRISNEEFVGVESPTIANSNGIIQYIERYEKGSVLTYYISYEEDDSVLDNYNRFLSARNMPVFSTRNAKNLKNDRGYSYINDYGSAIYKDAIQKAIYRMCIIGLIDDFTEDYAKHTFRITTICQDESKYYGFLRFYYRKYYSEERAEEMMEEVKSLAKNEGVIMACLIHLTSFIYKSIADKRARGILDMEQFCNMAISSDKDWKETNEDLKDFIYYYFNSKYAREGNVAYDSNLNKQMPFSLKDDTDHDKHTDDEIKSFELVKKYMRVVDPEIVNNDSQMDNIKHLQGAVRLIRRAILDVNPVLNLLNVFCVLYLGQQSNEMLEEELYNDYKAVFNTYMNSGKSNLIDEFTNLLISHSAIKDKEYINKIQLAIQLDNHVTEINRINYKYTQL